MTPQLPPREILSNPPPGVKYISICSGIEAATVAFHPLGWQPLAFAEIEAFPCAVLAHHYPAVPNLGDMTKYHEWPEEILAECDLLVGGPPCQAFSVAGQRRSLDDERGNLTLTYVNLINHIDNIRRKHGRDPIIALYENVPGIYSTKDNAFGCLVGAICGQDAPVETETGKWPTTGVFWGEKRRVGYRTLDAQYFGLAQRRRRCFLIAVPNELVERIGDRACPSEILSIAQSLRGNTPPSREARESVAHNVAPSLTSSGRGVERTGESRGQNPVIPCWWDGGQVSQTLDAVLSKGQTMPEKNRFPAVLQPVTPTLDARAGRSGANSFATSGGLIAHALRAEGFDASEDGTGRGTPLVPVVDPDALSILQEMGCGYLGMRPVAIQERAICENPDAGPDGVGIRTDGVAYTLEARTVPQAVAFAQNTRDEVRLFGGDGSIVGALAAEPGMKQTTYVAFSWVDHGADAGEIAPTLQAMGHAACAAAAIPINMQAAAKNGKKSPNMLGIGNDGDPAPTLGANDIHAVAFDLRGREGGAMLEGPHDTANIRAASGGSSRSYIAAPMAVRRLTPEECEKLQGFSVGYTLVPYRNKAAADGNRYKALGNSMAVPCMAYLGYRIQMALRNLIKAA